MIKLSEYLNERKRIDLTAEVTNAVSRAIENWKKDNIDSLEGWTTRDEDLLKLAEEMMDYFKEMKRSVKK